MVLVTFTKHIINHYSLVLQRKYLKIDFVIKGRLTFDQFKKSCDE